MQQKVDSIFFTTRSWSFWKQHRKRSVKTMRKIEKVCILYIYREYLISLQSNTSGRFLQKCTYFVEQKLKFSHFEASIIILSCLFFTILWWCQRFSIAYFLFYIHFIFHSSALYLNKKENIHLNNKSN